MNRKIGIKLANMIAAIEHLNHSLQVFAKNFVKTIGKNSELGTW